jgi:hypothetical protein
MLRSEGGFENLRKKLSEMHPEARKGSIELDKLETAFEEAR